ncbi:MAG TPA: cyclopropane-fatty-acyl-phospholipid synthase family protein [Thermoleophilaceae bacterium]|nr:cyclopropane-fatty-acyl-phospholipid synthase family protein [Thermoleophilaceae bacterium]
MRLLRRIEGGSLRIVAPGATHTFGSPDEALRVTVTLHDSDVWRALLRGSTGLGQTYMDARWDADDLTALVRLAARNAVKLDRLRERFALLVRPIQMLRGGRVNTVRRSRRHIARHYDLGNDLFAAMLDERMLYSSALFETPQTSLEDAQVAKLEAICAKLELRPDDHLLEIGTGWGGLAIHAAGRYGCRVTTTTISVEQHREAVRRVRAAGLSDRVTVLECDYRDLRGSYDKLVAVEMVEAVGWRNFEGFFERVSGLVEPDGLVLLQAILIDDRAYDVEKAGRSFITTFIFPGGALPSMEVMARCVRRCTDLQWIDVQDLTADYVLTLRHWRERFAAAAGGLEAAGYDRRFRRLWELYLRYCEAGFMERRITNVQALFAKPGYRRPWRSGQALASSSSDETCSGSSQVGT